MIAVDEAALRCDFLEIYHVFDYRELPARQAALFACGLPEGSRIMRKLLGAKATPEQLLLAVIADAVRVLVWQNTEDGRKGTNQPALISPTLVSDNKQADTVGFDSPEAFDAWRASMLSGGEENG